MKNIQLWISTALFSERGEGAGFQVLAALVLWAVCLVDGFYTRTAAVLFFLLFVLVRFKARICALVWIGLAALLMIRLPVQNEIREPEAGVYTIETIRDRYVTAQFQEDFSGKKSSLASDRVVVYNLESPLLGQQLLLENFEPIHSLNNLGLFSFQRYMNDQQIGYSCSEAEILEDPGGLKNALLQRARTLPAAGLYLRLFYSLNKTEENEWLSSLGLPVLGLFEILRRMLGRFLKPSGVSLTMMILMAAWMILMPFSFSVMRLFIFTFFRSLNGAWKFFWPKAVITCCLLYPGQAGSFSFVLPVLISLITHFQSRNWQRRCSGWFVCSVLQIAYFGGLNGLLLFGFSFGRRLAGLAALGALLLLPFQKTAQILESFLFSLNLPLDGFAFEGTPSKIVLLVFAAVLFACCFGISRRVLSACVLSLVFYFGSFVFDPFFHVYLLDIGQRDCTVIVEPFQRKVLMIDAAGTFNRDNASQVIVPFLKSRRISKIDALIITHSDFDHAGSSQALLESFDVGELITDSRMADADHMNLNWPFYSLNHAEDSALEPEEEDINDASIVSYFSYDEFSYLWTGDASRKVENRLLEQYDLKADVLKLGHHGSKTSSGAAFLEQVSPQLSLVSCGVKNRYGHPDSESLANALQAGSDILQTPVQGMVHLKTWKGWMFGECADGTVFWMKGKNYE